MVASSVYQYWPILGHLLLITLLAVVIFELLPKCGDYWWLAFSLCSCLGIFREVFKLPLVFPLLQWFPFIVHWSGETRLRAGTSFYLANFSILIGKAMSSNTFPACITHKYVAVTLKWLISGCYFIFLLSQAVNALRETSVSLFCPCDYSALRTTKVSLMGIECFIWSQLNVELVTFPGFIL